MSDLTLGAMSILRRLHSGNDCVWSIDTPPSGVPNWVRTDPVSHSWEWFEPLSPAEQLAWSALDDGGTPDEPVDDDLIERCAKKLHEGCPHCNDTGTVFEDYGGGHSVAEPCSSYEHAMQAADIVLRTAGRLTDEPNP